MNKTLSCPMTSNSKQIALHSMEIIAILDQTNAKAKAKTKTKPLQKGVKEREKERREEERE